jgi:hypothetical protein
MLTVLRRGERLTPEREIGLAVEEHLRLREEGVLVRRLHVRAGEGLDAIPLLDDQQAAGVVWILVQPDAVENRDGGTEAINSGNR